MKLDDQVCSLWLAKELRKLGVKQESLFYYLIFPDGHFNIFKLTDIDILMDDNK